jgi:hypothetical protein
MYYTFYEDLISFACYKLLFYVIISIIYKIIIPYA